MLRIYLAGEVQVENGDRLLRESKLGGPQGRFVLAHLVTERKRAVTQAELAEALWPESLPASWTLGLSAIVSRLRASLATVGLPRARIIGNAFGCYQFTPPGETWVYVEAALAAQPPSSDGRFCPATMGCGWTTAERCLRRAWSEPWIAGSRHSQPTTSTSWR